MRNSRSETQPASKRICQWGKYAAAFVLLVMMLAMYFDATALLSDSSKASNFTSNDSIPSLEPSLTLLHRNEAEQSKFLDSLHSADCNQLTKLRRIVAESKSDIWATWEVSRYPYFLKMMDIPHLSWDLQKAKFIKLLLDLQTDDEMDKSFVVGFSGSSITAGHG
jgi:hypothetical protein